MVPQALPCPPGSTGVAEGPPAATCSEPRNGLPGHPGSVRVGQGVPLRLGTAMTLDFRLDACPRRHHRSPTMPANPPSPHQDRSGPTRAGRRFLELNLLSRPPLTGSPRLLGQHTTPLGAHDDRSGPPLAPQRFPHGLLSPSSALSLLRTGALLSSGPPARGVCLPGVYKTLPLNCRGATPAIPLLPTARSD
jgi:hypothetical protein